MSFPYPLIVKEKKFLPRGVKILEAFDRAHRELFFVTHPNFKSGQPAAEAACQQFLKKSRPAEVWIYYPWRKLAVHTVGEKFYFQLRTARNRQVITAEEQENYRRCRVGIAGLSVGSGILSILVQSGGPQTLKIADFDEIEITNLNRLRAKLTDVGENKTWVAARDVWELDPFADLHLWDNGLNRENIEKFISGRPKLDIFIDEMDDLGMKIMARDFCRQRGIPVMMATDNGDGAILDVERFDQEPARPFFHGLIRSYALEELAGLNYRQWLKLATEIVGPQYLTERMQESILEIGKSVAGVPQLGTAASVAGAGTALAVRMIANGQPLPSGRYLLGLEEKIIPDYQSKKLKQRRQHLAKKIKQLFL